MKKDTSGAFCAELLSVGTELLLGDILNTNAQYLSRQLALCGVNVYYQTTVGDNPRRLKDALVTALGRSDVVITTGGLGPTADDLTKEMICECLDLPLVQDERALQELRGFFDRICRAMTSNNEKQAMVPEGAYVLYNSCGTAPGAWIEKDGKIVVMLPGPPHEMRAMFAQVRPMLAQRSAQVLVSQTLHVYGVGESALEPMIAQELEGVNPTVALYAKTGQVEVRVTAGADDEQSASALCAAQCQTLRKKLGLFVYSDDGSSMAQTVVSMLAQHNKTLAIAESCTGGLIAKEITDIPGSSAVFGCGIVSYANEIKTRLLGVEEQTLKTHGAVSAQTAAQMAVGAKSVSGADFAVSVTGIAGPGGGSEGKPVGLVYIGLADGESVYVKLLRLGQHQRDYIRQATALAALDMVRRRLADKASLCDDLYGQR